MRGKAVSSPGCLRGRSLVSRAIQLFIIHPRLPWVHAFDFYRALSAALTHWLADFTDRIMRTVLTLPHPPPRKKQQQGGMSFAGTRTPQLPPTRTSKSRVEPPRGNGKANLNSLKMHMHPPVPKKIIAMVRPQFRCISAADI